MWINVTFIARAEHAETLADALLELGALSAGVEDAAAGTVDETPRFGEPGMAAPPLWDKSRVTALFAPAADLQERINATLQTLNLADLQAQFENVDDQDWVRATQAQFEPIRINQRLWISPSWHQPPDPAAICLRLDPGLAFGTGSHPTTRLCLEWLCANIVGHESVLDYGCGSGILGIAAAKLGAHPVAGVDIDPDALAAAQDNAVNNQVALSLSTPQQAVPGRFDRVVANILTNPLCVLAPLLCARLKADAGARLALSGVLKTQTQQVIKAYTPWLALRVAAVMDGWALLEGQQPC